MLVVEVVSIGLGVLGLRDLADAVGRLTIRRFDLRSTFCQIDVLRGLRQEGNKT